MKRDVASAIALKHFDAVSRERIGRSKHVRSFGVSSKRNHRCVLKQKQHVADLASLAQIDELPL